LSPGKNYLIFNVKFFVGFQVPKLKTKILSLKLMKIGIYGGSFDPVHLGHLLVVQAAVEELGLDKIFFVPAAQSPFKPDQKLAPDTVRLQWLRVALAGKTNCEVDDQEIRRGGISYTVDTLRAYAEKFPAATLYYLIGADNAAKLNKWREAAELARLAEFVAIPRPGDAEPVFPAPFRGRTLRGFPFSVSSSEIRARVKANLPIENLVPAAVAEAIRHAKIYF
jgi:nicotinate-nucleotide adenylyltransferase